MCLATCPSLSLRSTISCCHAPPSLTSLDTLACGNHLACQPASPLLPLRFRTFPVARSVQPPPGFTPRQQRPLAGWHSAATIRIVDEDSERYVPACLPACRRLSRVCHPARAAAAAAVAHHLHRCACNPSSIRVGGGCRACGQAGGGSREGASLLCSQRALALLPPPPWTSRSCAAAVLRSCPAPCTPMLAGNNNSTTMADGGPSNLTPGGECTSWWMHAPQAPQAFCRARLRLCHLLCHMLHTQAFMPRPPPCQWLSGC